MMVLLLTLLGVAHADTDAAVQAYLDGDFAQAASLHNELLQQGAVNADVYYNLGNALYRSDQAPLATLAWRRAQVLAPRDGDVRANLEHARKGTVDRIDPQPPRSVLFWRQSLSPLEQGWGAALLLTLLGGLVLLRKLRPHTPVGIPALLVGAPGVLLSLSTALELQAQARTPGAVVLADTVEVSSAASGGVVLFELHAGAEVQLRERAGPQAQIALPDGRRGWLSGADLGVVDPAAVFPWGEGL